jgi:hypothetical protein
MFGFAGLQSLERVEIVRQDHALGLVQRDAPVLQPCRLPGIEGRGAEVDGITARKEDEIVEVLAGFGDKDRVMGEYLRDGSRNGRQGSIPAVLQESDEIEREDAWSDRSPRN